MILFWILWGMDVVVALVALYFFFVGLGDGSVSSFNGGLWFGILLGLAAVLGGSWMLKTSDHLLAAQLLLSVVAIPASLFFLYLLIAVLTKARWN